MNAKQLARLVKQAYRQGYADGRDAALTPEIQELIADGKAWQYRVRIMASNPDYVRCRIGQQ